MKLGVAGCKDVPEAVALDLLRTELRLLGWESRDELDVIAHGADRAFGAAADELAAIETIPAQRFPADWPRNGDDAGLIRNTALAAWLATRPVGVLLAFWDPRPRRGRGPVRRGTADLAEKAARIGCRVILCVLEVARATRSTPRRYWVGERVDTAVVGLDGVLARLDAAAAVAA